MPSTQDFLQIDKIRDGIIILKNKGLRAILMVSSLNFDLKSNEEQEAILYQFQNFLNSLDFSCQILIQSRRLNITGYLDDLKEIEEKEKNELLQLQIQEYRNFISQLLAENIITQKTFYVVVPFSPIETEKISGGNFNVKKSISLTEEVFQRAKIQLIQRAEFVSLGLMGCGLKSVLLNNAEIIELLWSLHHQNEAERGYFPEIPPEFK